MTARAGGAALRQRVRLARRSLGPDERQKADARIRSNIKSLAAYRAARRVAFFFNFDGEPNLTPLLRTADRKEFFAPIIRGKDMQFARVGKRTRLIANQFGIAEPEEWTLIDPRSLDLVLTPLVAFDRNGNRIGVGGGFYDRCFSFLLGRTHWYKPKLLGVAYALQEVQPIDPNPWDVPLWGTLTEAGFTNCADRQ